MCKHRGLSLLYRYRQSIIRILVGLFFGLLSLILFMKNDELIVNALERLEVIPYDLRLKLAIPKQRDNTPPIIIVDIDEKSLKNEGRFPWNRKKLATLVEKLHQQGAAVIALDILQSEPQTNPASLIKEALDSSQKDLPLWFENVSKRLDADTYFANMIAEKEVVLGYPFHNDSFIKHGNLNASTPIKLDAEVKQAIKAKYFSAFNMEGYTSNLPQFTQNAAGSGFISIVPDPDGTVRRAPLVLMNGNQLYPSLALEAARLYLMEEKIHVHTQQVGELLTIKSINVGEKKILTDAHGQLLIPFYGKQKHFLYLSATDVLQGETPIPELENAIVLVGTSAVGLVDLRPTPVEANYPGVEIQANILQGILHPETLTYIPDFSTGAIVAGLVSLTLMMTLVYPLASPIVLLLTGFVLFVMTIAINSWLWFSQQIYLPVMLPMLLILMVTGFYMAHHLFREYKDRNRIQDMFGQYVPAEHINALISKTEDLGNLDEKREMTVLFSDIRNFTDLSEPLSTRELKDFLNKYLTSITKIIFQHNGTVDKYVGDLVMAFWGAPLKNPKHAQEAVHTALLLQEKVAALQGYFKRLGLPLVEVGIGIHTGDMNVGDMGSDYRRAYTVLGDAVNLGSRLEGLTKFYQVKTLVSEDTKQHCQGVAFRFIDYVRVKGRKQAIQIYEPVGLMASLSVKEMALLKKHNDSLAYYQDGDWEMAKQAIQELFALTHEQIYQLYIDRIDEYAELDIEHWDGVYTHSRK